MMNWSEAVTKDWSSTNITLKNIEWTDLVMTRARHPNLLMGAKEFDKKLSEARDMSGDSICTHPRKHRDPFTGSTEVVDRHKIVCWAGEDRMSEDDRDDWDRAMDQ